VAEGFERVSFAFGVEVRASKACAGRALMSEVIDKYGNFYTYPDIQVFYKNMSFF
jgi:hypothetical protein